MKGTIFRWLHLSDFHVGTDDYGQRSLFHYIINDITQKIQSGNGPDAIFLTGDIGNAGAQSEYQYFLDEFFWPLQDLLPPTACSDRIFLIPGNHDVDRLQARAVRTHGLLSHMPTFLDPTHI
jgi:DNA repair exonuclease SbcCD nuclease subunit